jgi:hypothetical protein
VKRSKTNSRPQSGLLLEIPGIAIDRDTNERTHVTGPSVATLGARRGRPRKFSTPSRAITLTLPEHVIDALGALDPDLSRAVVRVTQPELAKRPRPLAELAKFGQRAVIVVTPTRTLEVRTGVTLIPMPDGRALISFDHPFSVAELELTIEDALDDRGLSRTDRAVFMSIAHILRAARRSKDVTLRQRHIIVLESRRPRGSVKSKGRSRGASSQSGTQA